MSKHPHLILGLSIAAGVVGLVVLHSILAGQSAAASAIQVGATIASPFNVSGDTSGSLVNNAIATNPVADATGSSTGNTAGTTATDIGGSGDAYVIPAAPAGVPLAGWGAALSGMDAIAGGHAPSSSAFATLPLEGAVS